MKVETDVEDRASVGSPDEPFSSKPPAPAVGHAIRICILVLAVITLFWRVFILGETLIDVATLNNQLPWGYSAAKSDYPYNRRDLTDTYVTREYFVAASYRDGEIPLWNPYTMAGHPIYADGVTRTLSPFLLFYKFFDVPLGYSLARIAELMLAAVFMYLFLIEIGASGNGALIGSLVFAFSSHSMLHLTGLGWWGGLMWLPLIFLFMDRAVARGSHVQALLAGVCLAAQFFCGYLPNQIYYVGAVGLFYLFFARGRLRPALAMMIVTLAAGLILSATQWVPALELLSHSNRKIVGAELGYVYLPPWYGATLIFPNLFGAAYDARMLTLFTALGVSHDHILYLGVAALAPLLFGLMWLRSTRRNKRSRAPIDNVAPVLPANRNTVRLRDRAMFFALLAAISLIIMMSAPVYVPVTRFIPVLQVIRVAVRAGVLFLFGATVLVAFGMDLLLGCDQSVVRRFARRAWRFAAWVFGFVLLAMICSYVLKAAGIAVETGTRGRLAFIRRALLALSEQFTPPGASVLFSLALVLLTATLLWLFAGRRLTRGSFVACLIALLIVDLFWNSTQFNRSFDRSQVFPRTEITDLLHSLPPGRLLVVPSELETNRRVSSDSQDKIIAPPNTLLPYQISTVTGKNQQFPKWYREYAAMVEPQQNLSHVVFDKYRSPYFDLLNVRYVLTHASAPSLEGYDRLASADGVSLYENRTAMPRAFFVSSIVAADSHNDAINALRESDFDSRRTAVVEIEGVVEEERQRLARLSADATQMEPPGSGVNPSPGVAAITETKRNRVVIQTDSRSDGLLVLSDNYYPGWRASIDDAPAQLFRANITMRAVNVPAGRHVISFAFIPAAFFVSLYVSLAAAALTLAILLVSALRRSRSNGHAIRKDQKNS